MKLPLLTTVCIIVFSGCERQGSSNQTQASQSESVGSTPSSSETAELNEAQRIAELYFGKRGNSVFAIATGNGNWEGFYELGGYTPICEGQTITEADRLNGIEWRVTVWMCCNTSRYSPGSRWQPWSQEKPRAGARDHGTPPFRIIVTKAKDGVYVLQHIRMFGSYQEIKLTPKPKSEDLPPES